MIMMMNDTLICVVMWYNIWSAEEMMKIPSEKKEIEDKELALFRRVALGNKKQTSKEG
jgi:hypothetical protein